MNGHATAGKCQQYNSDGWLLVTLQPRHLFCLGAELPYFINFNNKLLFPTITAKGKHGTKLQRDAFNLHFNTGCTKAKKRYVLDTCQVLLK